MDRVTYHLIGTKGEEWCENSSWLVEVYFGDMGEFAVEVVVVESVTHHKMVVDRESSVVGLEGNGTMYFFIKEYARVNRFCAAFEHELFGKGQRSTRVEDVIDEEDFSIDKVFPNIVYDIDRSGRARAGTVTR